MRVRLNILADRIVSRLKLALCAGLVGGMLAACGAMPEIIPPASEQPLAP